ncbi:hypothetical protein VKT23_014489 [Stygiomarasmius scandens]|uniref:Uncharacterized protein n=1 Tax=Marasmiellus scandens TaxID=2682957 RepID=A0ABR1J2J8_9AGAR
MPAGPPSVTETYAPMFVGSALGAVLYGVMLLYFYVSTCKRDALWIKLLIGYLFVADTANTIFDLAIVYEPLLLKWGEQSALVTSPVFLRADGIVTTLISAPVQIFMGWRIKVIMESWVPFVVIAALAVTSVGGALWLSIALSQTPQFTAFDNFRAAPIIWLITSAAADVLIAVCLVYALTGAITAIGALADAIVFIVVPHSSIFFSWDLCLSKLYTNTLLSSLNARNSWRYRNLPAKVDDENALFNYSDESTTFNGTRSTPSRMPQQQTYDNFQMTKIGVSREVHQQSDPEMGGEGWPSQYVANDYASSSYSSSEVALPVRGSAAFSNLSAAGDDAGRNRSPFVPQKPRPF